MREEQLEIRMGKLEAQVAAHNKSIESLQASLIGTPEKPGALEAIRNMDRTVQLITGSLQKLTDAVNGLSHDRSRVAGIVIGVGSVGTLVGFLLRMVLSK